MLQPFHLSGITTTVFWFNSTIFWQYGRWALRRAVWISGFLDENSIEENSSGVLIPSKIRACPESLVTLKGNLTRVLQMKNSGDFFMSSLCWANCPVDFRSRQFEGPALFLYAPGDWPLGFPDCCETAWSYETSAEHSGHSWNLLCLLLGDQRPTLVTASASVCESPCHQLPLLALNLHITVQPFTPSTMNIKIATPNKNTIFLYE